MKFALNVSPVASPEFWKRNFYYADGAAKHLLRIQPYTKLYSAGTNLMYKTQSQASGFAAGGAVNGIFLAQYSLSDLSLNWAKVLTDVAGNGSRPPHDINSMSVSPYDNALTATYYRPDDGSYDMKVVFTDGDGAISYAVDLDESTRGSPYNSANPCSLHFQSNGDLWVAGPHNFEEGIISPSVRRFEYFTNVYYLTRASDYLTSAGFKTIGERVDIPDESTETNLGTFTRLGSNAVDPTDDSLVMFGYECFEANDGTPEYEYFWPCLVRVTRTGTITSKRVVFNSFTPDNANFGIYGYDMIIDGNGDIYLWWAHRELSGSYRGGTYISKFNSSLEHQWSLETVAFTTASPEDTKLISSPDDSNLYVSWGTSYILEVMVLSKSTGERIDHGIMSGFSENDYTYQMFRPVLATDGSRVFVAGMMNQNNYRNGVSLLNTNQYDFERGGDFNNIRILYDRYLNNIGDNQARTRDPYTWELSDDVATATSYVGEYSYGGGLGASVTVTDASSEMQISSVTETATETFIQR